MTMSMQVEVHARRRNKRWCLHQWLQWWWCRI